MSTAAITPLTETAPQSTLPVEHIADLAVDLEPARLIATAVGTDDGALIHYTAGGLIDVPADSLPRLAAGERLPWEQTYIRTTPTFETSDERYAWLSKLVAVAYNELSPDHIDYRIYRVL